MTNKVKLGDCFQNAVKHLMDVEDKDLYLVHGLVTGTGGGLAGIRFVHAWIEAGDVVIDTSLDINKPLITRKERYYRVGHIKESEVKRYSYNAMCTMLNKYKIFGPWEVEATKAEKKLIKKYGY